MNEVVVPQAIYDELVADSRFLRCLMAAGVDNWEGYEEAQAQAEAEKESYGS